MTSAHFVRGASREQQVDFVFEELFRGVTLTHAQAVDARRIILQCVHAQDDDARQRRATVVPNPDGPTRLPGVWRRHIELATERDDALLALVPTEPAHGLLHANATAARARLLALMPADE